MKQARWIWRGGLYCAGLLVLTCGITLNTKTLLGVSPILSIPNCLSVLCGWDLGPLVTLLYLTFVLVQLQFPVSILSGRLVGLYDANLNIPHPSPVLRVGLLALAILLTGAGICLTVNMELAPNPADGLVHCLSQVTGKRLGLCKNLFDLACVGITVVLSLLLGGPVVGIGVGTVASMLLTGRAVAGINRLFRRPTRRLAGLEPTGEHH